MMQWTKSWFSLLAMALCLCAGVMAITPPIYAQAAGPSFDWLTVEMLKDSGVHLPSYLDSCRLKWRTRPKCHSIRKSQSNGPQMLVGSCLRCRFRFGKALAAHENSAT